MRIGRGRLLPASAGGITGSLDRHYLVSVQTLLLDVSNMEGNVDEANWKLERELIGRLIRRTKDLRGRSGGLDAEVVQFLADVEWILEDLVAAPPREIAERSKEVKQSIEERRLMDRIRGLIS